MTDCGCKPAAVQTREQQRTLWIALVLNTAMFAIEGVAGAWANSTSLIADAFDMLSDASAYAIALAAIGRSLTFKVRAANISGALLLLVGLGIFADVVRRAIWGSDPDGGWMIAVSFMALAVNVHVLRLLNRQQSDEIHMKAAWIFTRADVVANAAVIAAGLAVQVSGIRYFDLVVGAAIGLYVVREAFEILEEAREAKRAGPP